MEPIIGVVGIGVVGLAVSEGFKRLRQTVIPYDKYKNIGSFDDILGTNIVFLCLPTLYSDETNEYNKDSIHEICNLLHKAKYEGIIIIKSTVEPKTTNRLSEQYEPLHFLHNPEFLSARTNLDDFLNQKHIVIGLSTSDTTNSKYLGMSNLVIDLYQKCFPNSFISVCTSTESESMKSFVNCFYSVKIQFFNELYLLCEKEGTDYIMVKELMLRNGWINPMHTDVPGPDGKLSYGGMCFPKDTNALLQHMIKSNTPHKVLESVIEERNEIRDD